MIATWSGIVRRRGTHPETQASYLGVQLRQGVDSIADQQVQRDPALRQQKCCQPGAGQCIGPAGLCPRPEFLAKGMRTLLGQPREAGSFPC